MALGAGILLSKIWRISPVATGGVASATLELLLLPLGTVNWGAASGNTSHHPVKRIIGKCLEWVA